MLWFARASVGSAGFLGKILFALKKLFSSTIFSDFRYMHTGTWFSEKICIVFTKSAGSLLFCVLCYLSQPYLIISIKVLLAW